MSQLKSLKKAGDQIGKDISRGVNAASKEINRAVDGAVVVVSSNHGYELHGYPPDRCYGYESLLLCSAAMQHSQRSFMSCDNNG